MKRGEVVVKQPLLFFFNKRFYPKFNSELAKGDKYEVLVKGSKAVVFDKDTFVKLESSEKKNIGLFDNDGQHIFFHIK